MQEPAAISSSSHIPVLPARLLQPSGASSPQPTGPTPLRMAVNAAQHKVINLLKTLLTCITKFYTKFYYLDMYIFYISDHKLRTCLTILKDYWKGCYIIRVIMWVLSCSSVVADITKIMRGLFFFFAHQFSLVFVYLTCDPRQLFFQCSPETPKGWTPLLYMTLRLLRAPPGLHRASWVKNSLAAETPDEPSFSGCTVP